MFVTRATEVLLCVSSAFSGSSVKLVPYFSSTSLCLCVDTFALNKPQYYRFLPVAFSLCVYSYLVRMSSGHPSITSLLLLSFGCVTFKPDLTWDIPAVKLHSPRSCPSFFFVGLLMLVELEFLYLSFLSLFFFRLNLIDFFLFVRKTYIIFHSFLYISILQFMKYL